MHLWLWRSEEAVRPFIVVIAMLAAGCNAVERPEIINQSQGEDEVVSLPAGGALILRRAIERESPTCWVRARWFRGFVSMPCEMAERVRP